MNLLEAVVLRRAEEQLDGGAWRRADPDERDQGIRCVRCDGAVLRPRYSGGHGRRLCSACAGAGYRTAPCRNCGGVLHRRDFTRSGLHGLCGECRAEVRRSMGGA